MKTLKNITDYFKIHHKILFLLIVQIVVFSVCILIFNYKIFDNIIISMESNKNEQELTRVASRTSLALDRLEKSASYFSILDESYEYMKTQTISIEDLKLAKYNVQYREANGLMFISNDGKVVSELWWDSKDEKEINPVKELRDLAKSAGFRKLVDNGHSQKGILATERGFMFVTAQPILKSNGEGPKNGIVVFGYFVNEAMEGISLPKYKMSIVKRITTDNSVREIKNLPIDFSEQTYARTFIEKVDGKSIVNSEYYFKDILGENLIRVSLQPDSKIQQYMLATNVFLIFIVIFFILSLLVNYVVFKRAVITRIQNMVRNVSGYATKFTENETPPVDELRQMENQIEGLVDRLNEAYNDIVTQSKIDPLTGIYNRIGFAYELLPFAKKCRKNNTSLAIMFVDIDNFKNINEVYGHRVGDEVLQSVVNKLKAYTKGKGLIARISGDEFVLVIEGFESIEWLTEYGENLLHEMDVFYYIDGYEIQVSSSAGIAFFPQDGETIEEVMNNANAATAYSKKAGGHSINYYKPCMKSQFTEISIKKGIDKNEFYLMFQPQMNVTNNEIYGLETLIRWNHPKLGFVPPNEFISIAEKTGVIHQLGKWIIDTSFRQLYEWQQRGFKVPKLSINISPIQLHYAGFYQYVVEKLKEYNLSPTAISFEITESFSVGRGEKITQMLQKFSDLGLSIYIDDFGKEYSVLSYLEKLPIQGLKIDKIFVDNVETDDKVIRMIVALANTLELDVIVEGVEQEKQRDKVMEMGCNIIQGYLYSKPISCTDIETTYLIKAN